MPFEDMPKVCQVLPMDILFLHLKPVFELLYTVMLWASSEQGFWHFLHPFARHSVRNQLYWWLEKKKNLLYLGSSGAHLCWTLLNLTETHLWCSAITVTTSMAGRAAKVSSDSQDSIEKISLRALCLGSGGPLCYHIKDVSELCFYPHRAQWVHSAKVEEAGSGEHRPRAKGKCRRKLHCALQSNGHFFLLWTFLYV